MIISLLVIGAGCFYVYLAWLSLTIRPRTVSHWLLFLSACCAAYWAFFAFFAYNADTLETVRRCVYISVLGMFPYFPLNLLFVISVVPGRKLTIPLALLITLPSVFLFVLNFFYPVVFSGFELGENGWIFIPALGSVFNYFWVVYFSLCFSVGVVLLVIWRVTTKRNREKKQMAVLVSTQLAAIILILLEYVFHNYLVHIRPATISPVLVSVWIVGMVIAMKRYQFLSITPEAVSNEILSSINEIIILINEDEEMTYMNQRALSLFGIPYWKLDHSGLRSFLSGDQRKNDIIPASVRGKRNLRKGEKIGDIEYKKSGKEGEEAVHLNLTFSTPLTGTIEADMRVSRVLDKYGDPLGYLLVGSEVMCVAGLQERWGLTEREAEIVVNITEGQKNSEIALELELSEQTIKNHIESVYKKLGVTNRVELLNVIGGK
jgi:DNA-binding CsgD family transcriptional regulator